jgi:hypothetical protein
VSGNGRDLHYDRAPQYVPIQWGEDVEPRGDGGTKGDVGAIDTARITWQ